MQTLSGFERIAEDLFSSGCPINIPAFWKLRGAGRGWRGVKVVIHRAGFTSRKDNTSGLQKFMRTSIPALDCTNSSQILRNIRCKEDHVDLPLDKKSHR